MKKEDFFELLGELDDDLVKGAELTMKKKINRKVLYGAVAACLVVAIIGTVMLQGGLLGNKTETAVLDSGEKIVFTKGGTSTVSNMDMPVTSERLTEDELIHLFGDLPVTGCCALFYTISERYNELYSIEGKIGNVKVYISGSDVLVLDTVIEGKESDTEINGTSIKAGYWVSKFNSRGERNVIYYANFKLGDNAVYVEIGGEKSESERLKNELLTVVQALLNNGPLDLTSIKAKNID